MPAKHGLRGLFGGPRNYEKNFYSVVMLLLITCLIARFLCLLVIFVPDGHRFMYLEIMSPLPVIFKYMLVLYVCRFKLNLKYVTE